MTGADNFVLPLFERSFSGEEIRLLLGQARLENIHVFAAGVVPPYLPLLSRSDWGRSLQVRFVEQTRAFWQAWDHTRIAEWLGFYYFATGHKPTAAAAVDRIAA
jgi:hypothetical protein